MQVSIFAARRLQNTGSAVVAPRLSCSEAYGFFLDQGSNLGPLHWQVDSYLTLPPGKPCGQIF